MTDDWCTPTYGHLNAIRHYDGCRLVHPVKWDISSMPYTIMTDADWCIPPSCSFSISIQFKMSRIDQFIYNSINQSYEFCCQTFQISHFPIHMHFRNIISKIYSFHILNSYTNFMYSFHLLISYTHFLFI